MLRRVGKKKLIEILRSDDYRLYDPAVNGGLWVGKEYGGSPAYRRDPLHNLSHGATALQAARFYYLMETGRLVGPKLTRVMRSMLGDPEIHHKFVKGLDGVSGAKIYRKSGTWRQWHADSALVAAGRHKYIVVALAESPKGGRWLANMIGPIHRLIVPHHVAYAQH
jgi:beta-lactamase class A